MEKPISYKIPISKFLEVLEELKEAGAENLYYTVSVDRQTYEPLMVLSIPLEISKVLHDVHSHQA